MDAFFAAGLPDTLAPGTDALSTDGFIALEHTLADATEAQHIFNKMMYDAANEAIIEVYRNANRMRVPPWVRVGRVARPLPSPREMEVMVKARVATWSSMRVRDNELDRILQMDAADDDK